MQGGRETGLTTKIYVKDFLRLKKFKRKSAVHIQIVEKYGLPFILNKYKNRAGILAGIALFFIIITILSSFIWQLNVYGNDTLNEAEILQVLENNGLRIGSLKKQLDLEQIIINTELTMPKLLWITINLKGTVANIIIRERKGNDTIENPNGLPRDSSCNIIANKAGQISEIVVERGRAVVKVGDVVQKGQLLVSGIIPLKDGRSEIVNATAQIKARGVAKISVTQPLELIEKRMTGEYVTKNYLIFNNFKIKLFLNSRIPYEEYGIISNNIKTGVSVLENIYIEQRKYMETITDKKVLSQEEAVKLAKSKILNRIKKEFKAEIIEKMSLNENVNNESVILEGKCVYIFRIDNPKEFQLSK